VCENKGRALRALYDLGDGESLTAARDAQKHLVFCPFAEAVYERINRGLLVSLRLVF
jgi:hypothetical protein